MLTSYNNGTTTSTITYDGVGNPLNYRDDYKFTWQGRRLATTKNTTNGLDISYKYGADGLRTWKKNGTVESNYYYLDGKLMYEKRGEIELYFQYDSFGNLSYIKNGTDEYYVGCNSRGDVITLHNTSTGALAYTYTYDSWGNVISVKTPSGTTPGATTTPMLNPIRYRGYYYDSETGLYYLQSRYYDPVVGRFINADDTDVLFTSLDSAINDKNLFAYCDNNPINRTDHEGDRWDWGTALAVTAVIAGVVCIGALVVVSCGAAAPALALAGGGMIGGLGFSAGTVATATTVACWSGSIAVGSAAAAYSDKNSNVMYKKKANKGKNKNQSKTGDVDPNDPDPFARPEQKGRDISKKNKSRTKDNFKSRSNLRRPKPPKSHGPRPDHKKFK